MVTLWDSMIVGITGSAIAPFIHLVLILTFGYLGAPLWLWSAYLMTLLWIVSVPIWVGISVGVVLGILNFPQLRRSLLTQPILNLIHARHLLPTISETERAAIEAGTVWVEGEFFSGAPNFQRLRQADYPTLPSEVQAFLDGPVEQVCRMATDWEIHQRKDLPPDVWAYLKQERFLGMMIPPEYGGLGFSNLAYSSVMVKLASRSFIHTATVGVTNSLGPAKLLLNYGTVAQKEYYLPRLARGEEIPCFALTEPHAGSDAASITADGVVFKGEDDRLYLRLNFRKRYITLGAIATLIGLAFKLRDPDHLLGDVEDVGITCALIPATTLGLILGKRHDPMGVPFYNSPIEGQNVVVPVDQIIGGVEQAGQGWKMLMQSLAAGRGISFPATCTGVAQFVTRVTGDYAIVRRQFGTPIGKFEGIAEPLARIGGLTYLMEAARLYTIGAIDAGEKPAVVSAIAKYQFTELARQIVLDGMDVLGGAGICRGPRNLLAHLYTAMPIPITVEGANILTRSLMIFGQGVIRCHPYLYAEIEAIRQNDAIAFDSVLWKHGGLVVRNSFRMLLLSLTRGRLAISPVSGPTAQYYRKLAWASAMFACLSDGALLSLGGSLKRREHLTGRLADGVSWLYLGTATLRRFEAEGSRPEDLPLVHWSLQFALTQIQNAIVEILNNIPMIGGFLASLWRCNAIATLPTDDLTQTVARRVQSVGTDRDRLTSGIYLPTHPDEPLGKLEDTARRVRQAEAILHRIKTASQSGQLASASPLKLVDSACALGVITEAEGTIVREAELARNDAIQVDAFTLAEYQQGASGVDWTRQILTRS